MTLTEVLRERLAIICDELFESPVDATDLHEALIECVSALEDKIYQCGHDLCSFPMCNCHDDAKKALSSLQLACAEPEPKKEK